MAATTLYSSSSSERSILGTSYSASDEVLPQDASINSCSSSSETILLKNEEKEHKTGILRVRNPTPSPHLPDLTVIVKSSQKTGPANCVSSFGALKSRADSLYDTESTCEPEDGVSNKKSSKMLTASPKTSKMKASTVAASNEPSVGGSKPRVKSQQPLKHWVRQLHQRHLRKKRTLKVRQERLPLCSEGESEDDDGPRQSGSRLGHKKSSSWTSSAFVTTMQSATISLASFPTARRPKSQGSELVGGDNHTKSGNGSARRSTDRSSETVQSNDRAALTRATLRQHTLFEMMSTEASYIEDLKALVSTYRLIMDLMPAESTVDVHRCILGILELHETLLDRLRELGIGIASQRPLRLRKRLSMRLSENSHNDDRFQKNHRRSKSSDDVDHTMSEGAHKDRCITYRSTMEPNDAACVAEIFNSMLSQFFVYEEYAATYTTMVGYLSTSTQQISQWQSFERGLEALVNTMAPLALGNKTMNKPITYGDLLIKPIQRICKYPLLFGDLLKHTPVVDDPESHAVIEKALYRLRETTEEINKATTDEYTREKIERSWKLQDMLVFSRTTATPFPLRSLGRVELCGSLYVAYQSSTTVTGDYMLCALFKSYLVFAKPVWGPGCICSFTIVACISLIDVKLEATDKGKGLRCSNAPFTWKIVFEFEQRIFEAILCACSKEEEQQWRTQILKMATKIHDSMYLEERTQGPEQLALLALDIEPIGNAFLARRLSIQRAVESGGRLRTRQVIIKNTYSQNVSVEERPPPSVMKRSQSLLSGSCHTTILCPRRSTRICIEQEMHKVWSNEFLPYPGMITPREKSLRRSASHVIRKFSKNSLTGSIGKRSLTETSVQASDDCTPRAELSSSHVYQSTKATNYCTENFAGNSTLTGPRVHFGKEVLRKLPRKSTAGRTNSPNSSRPSTPSPPKALARVSSVSFEKLGAFFRMARE